MEDNQQQIRIDCWETIHLIEYSNVLSKTDHKLLIKLQGGGYMIPMSVSYFVRFLETGESFEYDPKMGSIHHLPSTTTYYKWSIEVGEFYLSCCYYQLRRNRKTGEFQFREWKNHDKIWENPVWSKWENI